jgi:hypothetical protein
MEIEKAVETADVVIVYLSNASISKEGYIQRELRFALNIALEKPDGAIFIIPVRLDDCELPRRLRSWHYVDYFPESIRDNSYGRIILSLSLRAEKIGVRKSKTGKDSFSAVRDANQQKEADDYRLFMQEVKIRSGDFFGKPKFYRKIAADEIRRISSKLQLADVIQLADSPIPGERVACGVALGEKIRNELSYATDAKVRETLLSLLGDHESFVQFRALEAISYSELLVNYFQPQIKHFTRSKNKVICNLSETLLRN